MSTGGPREGFSTAAGLGLLLPLFLLLPWGDGAMAAGNLLAVQGLILLTAVLHGGRTSALIRERPVTLTLIGTALAGMAAVGAVRVIHQVDPYGGWLQLINYLFFGLFYWLHAAAHRQRPERSAGVLLWLLAGILLAAGYGLWEQVFQHPVRVSGPFRDPNHLASLVVAGAAVVLARLVFGKDSAWRRRLWWLLPLGFLVWVLMLTGSRGGMLAFLSVLAAALLVRRFILVLIPLATAAGLLLIPNPFLSYLKTMASGDPYALERIGIWRSALEMIVANPLGVGLGNYGLFSAIHNFPVEHAVARFSRMPRQAHNVPLHLIAEGGWPMVLPLALLLAALLAVLLRSRHGGTGGDAVVPGALLGVLGLTVQAMVSKNLGNNALCFTMLYFLALLAVRSPGITVRLPRPLRLPPAVCATLVTAVAAAVFWFTVWVPYQAHSLSREAELRLADGDPAGAAVLLQRSIRAVPIGSYTIARLASLHAKEFRRSGDLEAFASAVRFFDRAIRLNPRQSSFLEQRADLYLHLARTGAESLAAEAWAGARSGYGKVLQIDPHRFTVRLILARMSMEAGEPAAAVRQLERAVGDEPNFIRGRLMLAEVLEHQGRTAEAEKQRREALERRQRYPRPLPGWGPYERELLR